MALQVRYEQTFIIIVFFNKILYRNSSMEKKLFSI